MSWGRQQRLPLNDNQTIKKIMVKSKATPEESRRGVLLLFAFCLLLIGGSIAYREIPKRISSIKIPVIISNTNSVVFENEPTIIPIPTPVFEELKKEVEEMVKPLKGMYGVYFESLDTRILGYKDTTAKKSFNINGETKFTAASMIKLPVLITLYREAEAGRVNLDEEYTLKQADKWTGSGSLYYRPVGTVVSYRKMAELMGQQSDNTAWHIIENLLGKTKIEQTIKILGMRDSSYADGVITPNDIGLLFRKLYQEPILSEKSRDEILRYLTKTIYENRLPAGLPEGIRMAHKVGSEIRVISDGGIVYGEKPYVLVVLSQEVNEIEAGKVLPEIGKLVYEAVTNRNAVN